MLLGIIPTLRSHYFSTISQLKHRQCSCNMEKIALGHGLKPNAALSFTSCCISPLPMPSCYFFPYCACSSALTSIYWIKVKNVFLFPYCTLGCTLQSWQGAVFVSTVLYLPNCAVFAQVCCIFPLIPIQHC